MKAIVKDYADFSVNVTITYSIIIAASNQTPPPPPITGD